MGYVRSSLQEHNHTRDIANVSNFYLIDFQFRLNYRNGITAIADRLDQLYAILEATKRKLKISFFNFYQLELHMLCGSDCQRSSTRVYT